jgi:integrase/recombinase XerD
VRKRRKLPVFLSPDESARLLKAARTIREKAIVYSLRYLGLRVSELCNLRVERIDLALDQVLIYRGKGDRDRMLPLNSKLKACLTKWLRRRRDGYLIPSEMKAGRPITPRAVQYLMQRLAKRAGIIRLDGQTVHPHSLRHTFASELVRKGVDLTTVRDLLGHASIATTQVYLHTAPERLRNAVNLL